MGVFPAARRERKAVSGRVGLTVAGPGDFRRKGGGFWGARASLEVAGLEFSTTVVGRKTDRREGRDTGDMMVGGNRWSGVFFRWLGLFFVSRWGGNN